MIANKYFFIQIKPLSGPIEEGTLVSIEGSNLGLKEEDVKGKIRIGHVPCELIDYQVSDNIPPIPSVNHHHEQFPARKYISFFFIDIDWLLVADL